MSVGIISSRFNNEIVEKISEACILKLQALGVNKKYIIPLDEKQVGVSKKPAQLYMFSKDIYEKTILINDFYKTFFNKGSKKPTSSKSGISLSKRMWILPKCPAPKTPIFNIISL